ncbi:MAG: ATP-binding protein [Ilumatobacteraceae bacterium]|nr:ATP-binding protein [Ilumatobacteraceae bacterium]
MGADDGWGARVRLRSVADLSMMRRRVRQELVDAGIAAGKVADTVLVVSELATNAFEASQPGTSVVVRLRIGRPAARSARHIEVDVDNVGAPVDGHLVPRSEHMSEQSSLAGRGLAIAATLGDVVVEGRIGGSRAMFRTPTD